MEMNVVMIDGIPVQIEGEKNLLELIRKAGIQLPVFCYYSELSVYGACRMCVVENGWGGIEAACSTPPKAGMDIKTNTPRLRKHRKRILELLLANHCRDCTTCSKNGSCKLQELALMFGIDQVRFKNTAETPDLDTSSLAITRDKNKCILCGDCVRMCDEVQNVGAIDFIGRGAHMRVGPAFDRPIAQSNCVGCGQCAAVCPTAAITVRNDTSKLRQDLNDPEVKVLVQIAPAVRVAIGRELDAQDGSNAMGRIVAALRRMGFDEVFDTSTGADLTVLEESREFMNRLEQGGKMPLLTSCCPAWVKYLEQKFPDMVENLSTCRSPMQMFASVLKEHYKSSSRRVVTVAVMPCTAKKLEAAREEFKVDGVPYVDHVITTQELIRMIRSTGMVFSELEPEAVSMPFGQASGAGMIFGVTGGVTEAVIRRVSEDKSTTFLRTLSYYGVRGMQGVKEAAVPFGDRELKVAVVSGLKNADVLMRKIQAGEVHYDFVEVMACPGGCVSGAGQPFSLRDGKEKRAGGLYEADRMNSLKYSEENPVMMSLYSGVLGGRVHELLHVHYSKEN